MTNPVWTVGDYVTLCLDVYYPVKNFCQPSQSKKDANNDRLEVPVEQKPAQASADLKQPKQANTPSQQKPPVLSKPIVQSGLTPFDELPVKQYSDHELDLNKKKLHNKKADEYDGNKKEEEYHLLPQTKYFYYAHSLLKYTSRWVRRDVPIDPEDLAIGFYAAYYQDLQNPTCGIIAYRGSDDIHDFIWHDMQMAMGNEPRQRTAALQFYKDVIKNYKPTWLGISGHSLGGALAQLTGDTVNYDRKQNDVHAVAYPVVCFNAPQMGHIVRDTTPSGNMIGKIKKVVATACWDVYNEQFYNLISSQSPLAARISSGFIAKTATTTSLSAAAASAALTAILALQTAVNELTKQKNLAQTAKRGDVGFNVLYSLLAHAAVLQFSVNNQTASQEQEQEVYQGYEQVYNFNALFDGVHVVGQPVGRSFSIDIDRDAHNKHWRVGMSADSYDSTGAYKYSPSDAAMYIKCDALSMLTLNKDYINGAPMFIKERIELRERNLMVASTTSLVVEQCTYQKHNINRVSLLKHLPLLPKAVLATKDDILTYAYLKHDLTYLMCVQHSIENLAYVITNDEMLSKLPIDVTISRTYFQDKIDQYYAKQPLPLYVSTTELDMEKLDKELRTHEELKVDFSCTAWQTLIHCYRSMFSQTAYCSNDVTGEQYTLPLHELFPFFIEEMIKSPIALLENKLNAAVGTAVARAAIEDIKNGIKRTTTTKPISVELQELANWKPDDLPTPPLQ